MRIIANLAFVIPVLLAIQPAFADDPDKYIVEEKSVVLLGARGPLELDAWIYPRDPVVLNLSNLSIAQRRMLAETSALYGTFNGLTVDCPVNDAGMIDNPGKCLAVNYQAGESVLISFSLKVAKMTGVSLPHVPVKKNDESNNALADTYLADSPLLQHPRFVRFDFTMLGPDHLPPSPPQGPLVDKGQIERIADLLSHAPYPSNAMREGAEGRLSAHCQIEVDLSVSCLQTDFEPAANASYFRDAAPTLLLSGLVGPTLVGGGSAIGAQFDVNVVFKLPH